MVFSRIKKQTEKLKEKNFADRAKSKGKQLASEVKKLTGDVEQGEELTEDVEETGDRDELKQDISEQRNIFEEFEVVEADAREVLTLEEEELESLHKGVEIDIEREKQVESIVLAFGDEIDGVERLVSEIRETLQSDVRKFNTQCFKQAKEQIGRAHV